MMGFLFDDLYRKVGSIIRLKRNMRLSQEKIEISKRRCARVNQFIVEAVPRTAGKRLNILR